MDDSEKSLIVLIQFQQSFHQIHASLVFPLLPLFFRNRMTDIDEVKKFDDLGYQFNEEQSDELNWVFIRPKD